ncbi:MAG TPA: FtsX-like permease family protein [Atribacterota bacterium]|nr:FtsX-like permease family protein [Atribacterota bacterium]
MKFLWSLAQKNLSRSRIRTIVSVIAIAIAIISVVFLRGLISGMLNSTFENHIFYKAGHIRIINREYKLKEHLISLNYTVDGFNDTGYEEMAGELKQIAGVEQVLSRLRFAVMVSQDDKLTGLMGWGIEPEEEVRFTGMDKYITEGRMVKSDERELIMGAALMDKIGKKVGDKVTFLYHTAFDSFRASTFQLVGKIESNLDFLNKEVLFLPLDQAQAILEMPGEVTELLIVTPDYNQAGKVLPSIADLFTAKDLSHKYMLQLWNRDYDLIELFALAQVIYNFVYIFIIILSCLVLINTLVMIINERKREIGMMSALGLKANEILCLFALEGMTIGVLGSALGIVIGGIVTKIFSIVGMDFSAAMEGMTADLLFEPIFYTDFSVGNLIFAFVLGVVVVTVASMIPARMAAQLEPTEAMR